jgi:hypothetical protein
MRQNLLALIGLAVSGMLAVADPPPVPPPTPPGPGVPSGFGPSPYGSSASQQFKDLIPGLVDALKDTDAEVRQHSAMALASLGHEALAPLTEAIKDPNKDMRAAAAYALGQMGYEGRTAMPALLKALKDEEAIVRRSSSQAISRILSNEGQMYGRGLGFPGTMPGMRGFGGGTVAPAPFNPPIAAPPIPAKPAEPKKDPEKPK